MMYKILGRKDNKAFCYPVYEVEESTNGGYIFRESDNTIHSCGKDEIVENPIFTGRRSLGYKEIVLT